MNSKKNKLVIKMAEVYISKEDTVAIKKISNLYKFRKSRNGYK